MKNRKRITKKTIYFDKEGNLYYPKDIKFGGEVSPSLNPREWFFLVLMIADKSQISKEKTERLFKHLVGSKSSIYRIKKSLINKGYL